MWNRDIRRKERRQINEESLKQYQATIDEVESKKTVVPPTTVPNHPMTGDLSRFMESTAEKKDEC